MVMALMAKTQGGWKGCGWKFAIAADVVFARTGEGPISMMLGCCDGYEWEKAQSQ